MRLASPGPVGWLYRNREALNGYEALPGKLADDLRAAVFAVARNVAAAALSVTPWRSLFSDYSWSGWGKYASLCHVFSTFVYET